MMYKISFYVPKSHLEMVKNALFEAGAGRIGNYDCCAWEVKGKGQFRPLEGSRPFSGSLHQIESGEEYLVEIVCDDNHLKKAITEFKRAHPYETPAYAIYKILLEEDLDD